MQKKPIISSGIEGFIQGAKDKQMNNLDGNINISKDGNISRNNSTDIIVVNKPIKEEKVERVSYYLKPSTMKKIKKLASKADMKISPWLQKFLEENIDKVEIK